MLADKEQAASLIAAGRRRPMDAGWDGAAGILGGDTPEVTDAKGVDVGLGVGGVVQVVKVLGQIRSKVGAVGSAVELEQFRPRLRDIDLTESVFVEDSLGGLPEIGAQIRIRFDGGAIDVPIRNVRAHGTVAKIGFTRRNDVQ